MKRSLPQAQAIEIIGPDRRILNTNYAFPAPLLYQVSRQMLAVHRNGASDLYISDVARGCAPVLCCSRYHAKSRGPIPPAGAGEINIATNPGVANCDGLAGEPGVHIALFRADGADAGTQSAPREPLRYPTDERTSCAPSTPALRGFISGASSVDRRARLLFYKAVRRLPDLCRRELRKSRDHQALAADHGQPSDLRHPGHARPYLRHAVAPSVIPSVSSEPWHKRKTRRKNARRRKNNCAKRSGSKRSDN